MSSKDLILGHHNVNKRSNLSTYLQELAFRGYDLISINEGSRFCITAPFESVACEQNPRCRIVFLNPSVTYKTVICTSSIVGVYLTQQQLFVFSFYLPPNKSLSRDPATKSLIEQVTKHSGESIFLGDANAHHREVGGNITSTRGKYIFENLVACGFRVINDVDRPTFTAYRRQHSSLLDWIFTNSTQDPLYSIDDDRIDSDHELIRVAFPRAVQQSEFLLRTFIHIPTFIKEATKLRVPHDFDNVKQELDRIIAMATRTVNKTSALPFWNQRLEELKIKKMKTVKASSGFPSPHRKLLKLSLKKLNALFYKALQEEKVKYEKRLLSSLSLPRLQKYIKKLIKKKPPRINSMIIDGETSEDPSTIAKSILYRFYPDDTHHKPLDSFTSHAEDDCQLSDDEISTAVLSHLNKAPGEDNLNAEVIKCWFRVDSTFITALFKYWFANRLFPAMYQNCNLVPIVKNATQSVDLNNIRPIGLLCVLAKMFESCIKSRLTFYLTKNGLINASQFGFTASSSTAHAVYNIHCTRNLAHCKCLSEHVLSLDISGAYDNVFHHHIISQLVMKRCPSNLVEIIKSYLSSRTVSVTIRGTTVTKPMKRGIVQGSVLGPLLFIVSLDYAINKLALDFPCTDLTTCKSVVYADDWTLLIHSPDLPTGRNAVKRALSIIESNLSEIGLQISIKKTKLLFSGPLARCVPDPLPIDNGRVLTYSSEFTILGVTLQTNRRYHLHCDRVIDKATAALSQIGHLICPSSRIDNAKKEALILSSVFSIITPLSSIWFSADKLTISKLKDFHKLVARKMTSAWRTVPSDCAPTLSRITPLHLLVAATAIQERQRITGLDPISNCPVDLTVDDHLLPHPASRLSIRKTGSLDNNSFKLGEDQIYIFTDGSKSDTTVGAAFAIFHNNLPFYCEKYKLPSHCSSFQAERLALVFALLHCSHLPPRLTVNIVTDCSGVLDQLATWKRNDNLAVYIKKLLLKLYEDNRNINLWWCRSHSGVPGNEFANSLANQARLNGRVIRNIPAERNASSRTIRLMVRNTQLAEFADSPNVTTLKSFFPDGVAPPEVIFNYHTTMMYTGHGHFRTYVCKRTNSMNDTACECNTGDHSPLHILTDCPIFQDIHAEDLAATGFRAVLDDLTRPDKLTCSPVVHQFIRKTAHKTQCLLEHLIQVDKISDQMRRLTLQ